MSPRCHSWAWFSVNPFNPARRTPGTTLRASAMPKLWLVESETDVFSASLRGRISPSELPFLPSLALSVFHLIFFGTILDPVFADFPSSLGIGSKPKTSLQDLAQPQTYHP